VQLRFVTLVDSWLHLKAVHLCQQLVDGLLPLIVAAS
jgi:hypothetical protein